MTQEVQTPMINPPLTTLEVIEWVGTSSEKIKYWRQTTYRTISYCTADVKTSTYTAAAYETMTIDWKFSNLVTNGKTDYYIGADYLRFPTEWSYEITIVPGLWYSAFPVTTYLYLDGQEVFSYLSDNNVSVEKKIKIDVWKYSKLTVKYTVYRNSSSSLSFHLEWPIWASQI